MDLFSDVVRFDWDEGNVTKSWKKHRVSLLECEQVFFNCPLVVAEDSPHSAQEGRFYALGLTDTARGLFVVFTIRRNLIRVISARDMSRKERRTYEKEIQSAPEIPE
jgi:hypothetical protein